MGKRAILLSEPVRPPRTSIYPETLDDPTIEQIVRSMPRIDQDMQIDLGPIVARVARGQSLLPWQQFVLLSIRHSLGDRPIYFASSGSAASTFGLRPHIIRQGLAFRLWPGDPGELADRGVVANQVASAYSGVIGPWVDIERSRLLADEVFMHRTGIPDEWSFWPDYSTIGIPNYYAWLYLGLLQDAQQRGDQDEVDRLGERWNAWSVLGSLPVEEIGEGGGG